MTNRFNPYDTRNRLPHRTALTALFILCVLLTTTLASFQDEETDPRRSWDRHFDKARAQRRNPSPQLRRAGEKPSPKPVAAPSEKQDDELIGVTIWRLRAAANNPQNNPRELTQEGEYTLERATADTAFREGDRVRLSVEYPRVGQYYLYVIDREVYSNGALGAPSLIYPGQTMPPDGNVLTPGKMLYIPAHSDPRPYFRLRRSRPDQVSERITLIVSREPLPLGIGPLKLDPSLVAKWEKEWGGATERREAIAGTGRDWTPVEKEADEKGRELDQGAPLPQTIYRVKAKPDTPALITIPLKIAP